LNRIASIATKLSLESIKDGLPRISYLYDIYKINVLMDDEQGRELALACQFHGRNFVILPLGLTHIQMRQKAAHECAHIILHTGNRNVLSSCGDCLVKDIHDYQAEVFTAFFLIPEPILSDKLRTNPPVWYLAEIFGVTVDLMTFRLAKRQDFSIASGEVRPIDRLANYV
jgi:Zn-dependent peptidase ImmA (M78 family)